MQVAKPRQEAAAVVAGAIAPPPRHSTAVATAVAPPSAKTRQFEKRLVIQVIALQGMCHLCV